MKLIFIILPFSFSHFASNIHRTLSSKKLKLYSSVTVSDIFSPAKRQREKLLLCCCLSKISLPCRNFILFSKGLLIYYSSYALSCILLSSVCYVNYRVSHYLPFCLFLSVTPRSILMECLGLPFILSVSQFTLPYRQPYIVFYLIYIVCNEK